MKKILAVSAFLASVAAFATPVTSDNTFGVMKISDSTSQQLIISVPWESVGSGDAVKITDLVLPTGLANGTTLYYYDGSKFMAFEIKDGVWVDGELDGGLSFNANQSVVRGAALIVSRSGEEPYPPIYLSGQYVASTGNSTVAAATAGSDVYSLIAPCGTGAVVLNDVTWTGAASGDTISHGTNTYSWDGTSWYYEENGTGPAIPIGGSGGNTFTPPNKVTAITIPAGQGVWYKRAKGGGSFTVTW